MQPVMPKMSNQLAIAAAASTLALAAFALDAPSARHGNANGAGLMSASAALPTPSYSLPALLR